MAVDPLEVELLVVVRHVDAGNQTPSPLQKQQVYLTSEPSPAPTLTFFSFFFFFFQVCMCLCVCLESQNVVLELTVCNRLSSNMKIYLSLPLQVMEPAPASLIFLKSKHSYLCTVLLGLGLSAVFL